MKEIVFPVSNGIQKGEGLGLGASPPCINFAK